MKVRNLPRPGYDPGMAKNNRGDKKPSGGKHTTPRTSVQIPDRWYVIMKQLARADRQPVLWWLLAMTHEKAKAAGIPNLPPPPWEDD
jgi:hypothetical protein